MAEKRILEGEQIQAVFPTFPTLNTTSQTLIPYKWKKSRWLIVVERTGRENGLILPI